MKSLLKATLHTLGLQITRDFRIHKLFQKNVFKTNHKKKVLIIYITRPFIIPMNLSHTNLLECYTAAEVFRDLGYNVDVIDCNIEQKVDFEDYEVIYGMGEMMEKSLTVNTKTAFSIFYGTGLNPIVWNVKSAKRMRDFYQRHGKLFWESSRMISHPVHRQVLLSDAVIALGDSYNFKDYTNIDNTNKQKYHQISSFYYDSYDIELSKKDFSIARKNFLWFGSSGVIHKGLDIVLDIFSNMKDVNLHICGANPSEKDFLNHYADILSSRTNIINHGFLNLRSEEFRKLMGQCGFVVFPSCAEGGAPSVLNCAANGGLVPIITRDCGLDIDEYGWSIESPDIESCKTAINEAKEISEEELRVKSMRVKEHVREVYTYNKYRNRLKQIISDVLSKNNQQ